MTDERDFDERMVSLRVCDDPDDPSTTDIYMRLGTLREKARESGCTICELSFVSSGTTMSFLAPVESMRKLARFIMSTAKDYGRLDARLGDFSKGRK